MSTEYWAVFSMHDHQKSIFRKSLLSFEQIIFPVPSDLSAIPTKDINEGELDRYISDVEYLESEGVAVRHDWNQGDFRQWCKKVAEDSSEELYKNWFNCATRLYLQQKYAEVENNENKLVTPVPVFLNRNIFETTISVPRQKSEERLMLEIVLPNVPVPSDEVPLDEIVALRNRKSFQNSLKKLRDWQVSVLPELYQKNNEEIFLKARKTFESYVEEYCKAIEEAKFKKKLTIAVWIFNSIPFIPLKSTILKMWDPKTFSFTEIKKPCWEIVSDKPFAPAGVIYEASTLKRVT